MNEDKPVAVAHCIPLSLSPEFNNLNRCFLCMCVSVLYMEAVRSFPFFTYDAAHLSSKNPRVQLRISKLYSFDNLTGDLVMAHNEQRNEEEALDSEFLVPFNTKRNGSIVFVSNLLLKMRGQGQC